MEEVLCFCAANNSYPKEREIFLHYFTLLSTGASMSYGDHRIIRAGKDP